jgi:hypothetical protein
MRKLKAWFDRHKKTRAVFAAVVPIVLFWIALSVLFGIDPPGTVNATDPNAGADRIHIDGISCKDLVTTTTTTTTATSLPTTTSLPLLKCSPGPS